jgi:hypothetical protein
MSSMVIPDSHCPADRPVVPNAPCRRASPETCRCSLPPRPNPRPSTLTPPRRPFDFECPDRGKAAGEVVGLGHLQGMWSGQKALRGEFAGVSCVGVDWGGMAERNND